jgi:hypothetical protein
MRRRPARVARVPRILGGLNLLCRGLESERRERRSVGHRCSPASYCRPAGQALDHAGTARRRSDAPRRGRTPARAGDRPGAGAVGSRAGPMALPLFDLPLDELRATGRRRPPPTIWTGSGRRPSTRRGHQLRASARAIRSDAYRELEVADVTFAGAGGDSVKAGTYALPARPRSGFPAGDVHRLRRRPRSPRIAPLYPACGYATFVMDTRAQGGTWSRRHARPGRRQLRVGASRVMTRGSRTRGRTTTAGSTSTRSAPSRRQLRCRSRR